MQVCLLNLVPLEINQLGKNRCVRFLGPLVEYLLEIDMGFMPISLLTKFLIYILLYFSQKEKNVLPGFKHSLNIHIFDTISSTWNIQCEKNLRAYRKITTSYSDQPPAVYVPGNCNKLCSRILHSRCP